MRNAKRTEATENTAAVPDCLIALSEWEQSAGTVRGTVKEALRNAWRVLQQGLRSDEGGPDDVSDTASLSSRQLARYAPSPDWSARSAEVGAAVDTLQRGTPVKVVVAPPYSGLVESLEGLAKSRGWRVISPPDELLMSQQNAADWWREQDLVTPWVLPDLARFWLRHRSGLVLVRELLTRLARNELGQGVVGCSSWCWAFWMQYMPELAISALTLAPLDDDRLGSWFINLAERQVDHPLSVRMAHNDKWAILPDGATTDSHKSSNFLKDLAATTRGNSGVALAIWRIALQARPDRENDETSTPSADCWVLPLAQIKLPVVPGNASKKLTYVLHALLLHSVLTDHRLVLTTGLTHHDVSICLHALMGSDLVVKGATGWFVTALGYPAIRRHLQSDGYPMDQF